MDTLPSYTTLATAGTTKRTFAENGVTIDVLSHAASKTSPPIFHNESVVSGSVEVVIKAGFERKLFDLGSGPGRMNQTNLAEVPFLNLQQILYDKTQQQIEPGIHKFDFRLAFPKTFTSSSKKTPNEIIELPPTFQVPGYPTYIQYQLKCVVTYSGLPDDTIVRIPVNYVPRKEAGAPSPPRALAYETGTPLPDPNTDPDGWHSESADVDLRVFGARDARLHCVLSLPLPLEYPRGYPIPLHLTLTSADTEVLDLLSTRTPDALDISLHRRMFISQSQLKSKSSTETREWLASVSGKGVYWGHAAAEENQAETRTRYFEGEIKLSNQMMQNFTFPKVSLTYTVELKLQVSGLTTSTEGPIIKIPVDITYFPAKNSPRPRSYAPEDGEKSTPAPDESMYFMMHAGAG